MENKLRIMQMIDSLSIGGAERVSVNYANAIAEQGHVSFHCTTREEGMLKEFLHKDVESFFMKKKSLLDRESYQRLIKYINENKISIIHAHSSSFFTAVIVKLFTGVKIVWHDHYGHSEKLNQRPKIALKLGSLFFSHVISVNKLLESWAKKTLFLDVSKIEYLPNYADLTFDDTVPDIPGISGKRIVVLANLRPQKDHMNMLKAFKFVLDNGYTDWNLLFVGRDWKDSYSDSLKAFIHEHDMSENVSILGGRSDASQILKNCDIGVLSSESEGLPVALLEYGLASLAVVSTNVGECSAVLDEGRAGKLVEAKNSKQLGKAIIDLIQLEDQREDSGNIFFTHIQKNYSKKSIMNHVEKIYIQVLKSSNKMMTDAN